MAVDVWGTANRLERDKALGYDTETLLRNNRELTTALGQLRAERDRLRDENGRLKEVIGGICYAADEALKQSLKSE